MSNEHGSLLAVDPSIRSTGLALFRAGVLSATTTIELEAEQPDIAARCLRMGREVLAWLSAVRAMPTQLAVEWPQIYRAAKSKGSPNDLPGLAGVSMAVAGVLSEQALLQGYVLDVRAYLPAEWAGQLPKSTRSRAGARMSPRAKRIASRLSDEELSKAWTPVISHDAIDAIGIGLHALGRFERLRILPGAS